MPVLCSVSWNAGGWPARQSRSVLCKTSGKGVTIVGAAFPLAGMLVEIDRVAVLPSAL
jgi:hypothetical protein